MGNKGAAHIRVGLRRVGGGGRSIFIVGAVVAVMCMPVATNGVPRGGKGLPGSPKKGSLNIYFSKELNCGFYPGISFPGSNI